MSWVQHNFLWDFYPNLKWQLFFIYLLGFALLWNWQLPFTFLYIILVGFFIFFYRKPTVSRKTTHTIQICNIDGTCRTIASDAFSNPSEILSPAFGTISSIIEDTNQYIIKIELNIFDFHSQYCPVSGIVEYQNIVPNKSHHTIIKNKRGYVSIKQLSGLITRKIRTNIKVYQNVSKGEYLGFIELGSHVELTIPKERVIILVKEGDIVEGYKTAVGKWII